MKYIQRRSGFSLVEVVVSVGIFAVAIVGIIGLFAPTTKNVAAVADSDASTRAVAAIQQSLKETASTTVGFNNLISAIDNSSTYYYASRGGDKVDSITTAVVTNKSEAFFEYSLSRNTALSPSPALDASAGFLAFTIQLRWPAYLPTADGITGTKVTDDSQKSTLIVPAAVTR
jgi:uncharacterized protein (TIGR02598 family)